MSEPTHLKLAIINRGRVLVVDEPVPNMPDAIDPFDFVRMIAGTRRALHFQLRDPCDGSTVMVLEHGAARFEAPRGYRHG